METVSISDKERNLLIKLAILFLLLAGMVWGTEIQYKKYAASARIVNGELSNALNEIRTDLSKINEQELLQSQYVETYNAYKERNLILGPQIVENEELFSDLVEENRIYLLEKLQEIKEERKFFKLQYNLDKPSDLPASFSKLTADSTIAIRASIMQLEMPLLHSLDILMLLNDFYDDTLNRFTPVSCVLTFNDQERTGSQASLLELSENISSECKLVWLSVYDPQQGKGDIDVVPESS